VLLCFEPLGQRLKAAPAAAARAGEILAACKDVGGSGTFPLLGEDRAQTTCPFAAGATYPRTYPGIGLALVCASRFPVSL
jgi:hypothetical protein